MKQYSFVILGVILIVMFSNVAKGQESKNAEKRAISPGGIDWCENSWGKGRYEKYLTHVAMTPLQLELSQHKRFILLVNCSDKNIVSYKYGFLVEVNNEVKIIPFINLTELKIDKGYFTMLDSDLDKLFEICKEINAKLIVFEVNFDDGSFWQFSF